MKYLAIENELPGISKESIQPFLKAEAGRLWELYLTGLVREMYFRADRSEAVLVLECNDLEQAQAALASLPFVQEELITFEVIPLIPYPGFARLFS